MDWMALIMTLITTFLPAIINKGPEANKMALRRRQVFYGKLAEAQCCCNAGIAAAAYEASELCNCLADCKTQEEQEQVFAKARDGFATSMAEVGSHNHAIAV